MDANRTRAPRGVSGVESFRDASGRMDVRSKAVPKRTLRGGASIARKKYRNTLKMLGDS